MNWLGEMVQSHVTKYDTVLDLGCGIMMPTDDLRCKNITGCDLFERYLDHIKDKFNTIKLGLDETDRFMDNSYDIVICLDVVEHLERELALKVLDEVKRICRKKAIIFTPKLFDKNEQPKDGAWGLGENHLQNHLCQVTANDLNIRNYKTSLEKGGYFGVYSK